MKILLNIKQKMKLWAWKHLKKNLNTLSYVNRQIRYWAEQHKSNEWFKDFKCSIHFEGYHLANENLKIYEREYERINHHLNHLYLIRGRLEESK